MGIDTMRRTRVTKGKEQEQPTTKKDGKEQQQPTTEKDGKEIVSDRVASSLTRDQRAEGIANATTKFEGDYRLVPHRKSFIFGAVQATIRTLVNPEFEWKQTSEDILQDSIEFEKKCKKKTGKTTKAIQALNVNKNRKNASLSTTKTSRETLEGQLSGLLAESNRLEKEYIDLEAAPILTAYQKKATEDIRTSIRNKRMTELATLAKQKKKAKDKYSEVAESVGEKKLIEGTLKAEIAEIERQHEEKTGVHETQKEIQQDAADIVLARSLEKRAKERKRKISEANKDFIDEVRALFDQTKSTKLKVSGQALSEVIDMTVDEEDGDGCASRK